MTTSAIIEARMTSSRLPGKVLKKVLGKSMLKYLIERLKLVDSLDNIIIATTKNSADDVIEKFSIMESIKRFPFSGHGTARTIRTTRKSFTCHPFLCFHHKNLLRHSYLHTQYTARTNIVHKL